jgi:RHS repeat-associated protein
MISDVINESLDSTHYTYDGLDRLTSESYGSVVKEYSYDNVGNRTSKTNNGVTVAYAYSNGCNRLVSSSVTSTNISVVVDVSGFSSEAIGLNNHFGALWVSNMTAVTPEVSGSNFWVYDLQVSTGTNAIVAAIRDAAGNIGYATNTFTVSIVTNSSYLYNVAGCLTNISCVGQGTTENIALTWDSKYQVTEIKTNGVSVERNCYDVLGRRCWSWDGSETNYFVYSGNQIIADVDATGGLKRVYVYAGLDRPLAMTVYTSGVAKTYYYLTDHLGSVHAITDETGDIVESYRYDAWGRFLGVYDASGVSTSESVIGNRYLWQGREYSYGTGLYYFRSRWYDPITGRWLSKDPIGISGGLNQYMFCGGNPVNFMDPWGLWTEEAHNDLGRYGGNKFDYARLDRDHSAVTGTYNDRVMHFRSLGAAIRDAKAAAERGDVRAFEYHVHEVQDYFAHTAAGYGPDAAHFWTMAPDDPDYSADNRIRYNQAGIITRLLEDYWDKCESQSDLPK